MPVLCKFAEIVKGLTSWEQGQNKQDDNIIAIGPYFYLADHVEMESFDIYAKRQATEVEGMVKPNLLQENLWHWKLIATQKNQSCRAPSSVQLFNVYLGRYFGL